MAVAPTFFAQHPRLGIDTNVLIYFIQDHPRYAPWCASLFERVERRQTVAVASTIALLETLVQPYRSQNDELVQKVFALFSTYPGLVWTPVTIEVADRAAELRARHRLSTPDAIHVATALTFGATAFVGNDKALRRVSEIECLTLDEVI